MQGEKVVYNDEIYMVMEMRKLKSRKKIQIPIIVLS